MERKFNEKKAIQVVALFMKKRGGAIDLLNLTKLMYLADRAALVRYGKSLTGDRYASMEKGMVLSTTYDLSKGKIQGRYWDSYISAPSHNFIMTLLDDPNIDELSENEMELIEEVFQKYGDKPTAYLIERVHHTLPEWVDVGKSSLIIRYKTVLEKSGWEEEQIEEFLEQMEAISYFEQYSS